MEFYGVSAGFHEVFGGVFREFQGYSGRLRFMSTEVLGAIHGVQDVLGTFQGELWSFRDTFRFLRDGSWIFQRGLQLGQTGSGARQLL